jgi:ABC-type tungstate transport system permease subunit
MRIHRPFSLLVGLLAVLALVAPSLATADSASTLTVIGTSDVSDSGLMPSLIQPQFTKAFPQYTFKYIGTATGTAIANAESGSAGASVLIVHAPSLENLFVGGGFSEERFGRALFTNDFVLAGPKSDPAGVGAAAAHDVVAAFTDVARAGIAGKATFVSRGGTPGTTVEEHQLWALVAKQPALPSGLLLCAVGSAAGGGDTPIAPGNGVTATGQPCPNNGALPTGSALPGWYVTTGLTQGPNVIAADACTNHPSGAGSCYVLTDRGTFDYLASGTDPAGSIPSLQIVTRDDSSSAPGGANALINYFHGYIINPGKPNEQVNLPAAQAFLNFLTSPAVQAQLSGYLAHTSDPGGAPFKADASPSLGSPRFPRVYRAGRPLTVAGTLTNLQPNFPALSGETVSVDELVGGVPVPVAHGRTDSAGRYRIRFTPQSSGLYEVSTGQIAKVEIPTLSPPYGDLLSPAATAAVRVTVQSAVTRLRVRGARRVAFVSGTVAPGAGHVHATVTVLARRTGARGRFRRVALQRMAAGRARFARTVHLRPGSWQIKVAFEDPSQVRGSTSRTVRVTIS